MATILERSVVLDSEGRISIPKEIRDQVGLTSGAQLGISSLAGLIILYRGDKDLDAFDVFARFGQLLREEGYDTSEKVDLLVKEIKRETTEDWLRRCRSRNHEFIRRATAEQEAFECLEPAEFLAKYSTREDERD